MSQAPDDRIRPSVYLIAFLLAAGSGWAVWAATSHDPLAHDDEVAQADEENRGRRGGAHTWRDQHRSRGARGSSGGGHYTHHDWSQESDTQRMMSLDLPSPRFWSEQPGALTEARRDPQLFSMWRSFHGQNGEGDPALPFEPTARHATLLDSEGDVVSDPSSCAVRVLPTRSGRFNCLVRVMCDGQVLYPDDAQRAGYVPCDIEDGVPVRAMDDGATATDGDPQVSFDMSRGTVTVADYDENGAIRYRATLALNQS